MPKVLYKRKFISLYKATKIVYIYREKYQNIWFTRYSRLGSLT